MSRSPEALELEPRKWPAQARSRATFDALVEACEQLLPELGYAGTTTNHIAERAGVGVASLYEYFPGKDAIVARVAERLVNRVLGRLAADAPEVLSDPEDAPRRWIELILATVEAERSLVAVFVDQVPYTGELDVVRAIQPRLLSFSLELRRRAGDSLPAELSAASVQLLVNLVTSTILQIVLDPPPTISREALLEELVFRFEAWLR